MSVSYSLVKYVPKFGKNAGKGKFYARAQVNEKTSLKKFSKMIAMQTTVTYADVTAVLVSAVENLILELQRGNQVEFGDLGKFRLQIVSDGADSAADFKSDTHIKGVNVQYAPGPELYSVFQNMEFVQVASRAVQRAALKAEKEGAKTIDIEEVKKAASKKQNTSGDSSAGGDSSTDGEHTSGGSTTVGATSVIIFTSPWKVWFIPAVRWSGWVLMPWATMLIPSVSATRAVCRRAVAFLIPARQPRRRR